jgi:transcriptional regulator with XRE-family HTH domain
VSVSAIAQIEAGRRVDVRVSSLLPLAEALDISIDHLVGRSSTPLMLQHQMMSYRSDDEFQKVLVPYLTTGAERDEAMLVVTTPRQIGVLREALADVGSAVEFADSTTWYSSPPAALRAYQRSVAENVAAGRSWVRVVGEPVWRGRSATEVGQWIRYESLINVALAACPATIVCPYDARTRRAEIIEGSRNAHPEVVSADGVITCAEFRDPADFLFDDARR